jgi:UDP-N-acetylglucosamine--N-acetylmuramyl-(pentapeptide) pyrophosphoryl-undecaprenol N-acetylglucosamine transferase
MASELYIFAGGGTGGHLYPGLAVAEELLRLRGTASIVFASSDRAIDAKILGPLSYGVIAQPVRPLPRSLRDLPGFLLAWRRSKAIARDMIRDLRPRAVLGLGGFAAGPLVLLAARAGIRTAMINSDAVPGKANRHLARVCDVVFSQFQATAECFPAGLRDKVRCVGCPVRAELLAGQKEEATSHFGLRADRKTLLVFGGSLLSASINEAAVAIAGELASLAESWQILHVTGADKDCGAAAAYQQAGLTACTLEYCDRMDLAYATADLAVCRGGASTIAELTATGTPAVILPYPHHRDQQQRLNADALVAAGASLCVTDTCDRGANAAALRSSLLPLLADEPRLLAMRQAAASLARPDAAQTIARWLAEA